MSKTQRAAPEAARRSGHAGPELAYRPDIDGLRAVAVLLVVLNHAGLAFMPGGFVGVDVFFVISGFLITGLIAVQAGQGRFRFWDFYLRRAKRLLPALYVLMAATLAAGWFLLIPSDYTQVSKSVLWAVGLASNLFFWANTGGYFSSDAASFPLLHVWSLSLEEQFYLVWPAVLLVLLRLKSPRLRLGLVAGALLVSLACAQRGVMLHTKGAYFLPPARGWEFLVGALLFLVWRERERARPALAYAASSLGLMLVIGSAVALDARSPFPGLAALPACAGAALMIAAPMWGPSPVTRLLSSRPLVGVGLISYSVYLWHWPIVSFLHILRIPITLPIAGLIVAASLAFGWISWALLERGLRSALDARRIWALGLAALGAAALVGGALTVIKRQGLPERFPFALLTQEQLTAERGRYWRAMKPTKQAVLAADKAKQLLIVGNSHAYDLAYALNENGYPGRIKLIETFHECFNFGHDPMLPENASLCRERLAAVLGGSDLRAADAVYLHDNWGRLDEAALSDMIRQIRARTAAPIVVFGPKMVFTDDVLPIAKAAMAEHYATAAGINGYAARFQDPEKVEQDQRLKAFFASHSFPGVRYVSTLDVQCGVQRRCELLSEDGRYLYFDSGHLTLEGARRLGLKLKRTNPDLY